MSDETTQKQDEVVEETIAPETPTVEEGAPETTEAVEEAPVEEVAPEEDAYVAKLIEIDELCAGQTVRLHERIKDVSPKGEERERVQVFEGIILALGGSGISRTITLRKVSNGIGVEKIYPINSPVIAKIELVKSAKVRQAKLGYLKDLKSRFKRKLKETHTELGRAQKNRKKR